MAVAVYNYAGAKQTTSVSVPKVKPLNEGTLSDVLRSVQGNAARGRALVKTRGFVSGGGAKPWRQKGTGRARAGTNRSPLWRGGGITFGPTGQSRAYRRVPSKVRKAAILTMLARRAEAGDVIVLSGKPSIEQTKQAKTLFSKLPEVTNAIFVVGIDQYDGAAGSRNLKGVELTTTADLNAVDLARAGKIIASKEAWDALTTEAKPAPKAPTKPTAKAAPKKTPAKKKAS